MGNIVKPVPIELDKSRSLYMDLNAMVKFEEATGKRIFDQELWVAISARDVRALLWACLLHEDPDLTVEQVGSMIDFSNMNDVIAKLQEAFMLALPNPDEQENTGPLADRSRLTG